MYFSGLKFIFSYRSQGKTSYTHHPLVIKNTLYNVTRSSTHFLLTLFEQLIYK